MAGWGQLHQTISSNNCFKINGNSTEKAVYFVIDTNGPRTNFNVAEICQTIRDVMIQAPTCVKFNINVFSPLKKLVSQQLKVSVDANQLVGEIHGHCSGSCSTALYDAWAFTMNEIPYCDGKAEQIELVVFTQYEDNSSIIYNLDSTMHLLNDKLQRNVNMHFTIVGFNPQFSTLQNTLNERLIVKDRCNVVQIMNIMTPQGTQIMDGLQQLTLQLQSRLNSKPMIQTQSTGYNVVIPIPAVKNARLQNSSANRNRRNVGYVFSQPDVKPVVQQPCASMQRPMFTVTPPKPPFTFVSGVTVTPPKTSQGQPTSSELKPSKVWVGNIPMVDQEDVLDFLQQWGPCRIETINGTSTQWAVVAYYTEKSMENAVKFGNGCMFRGQMLNINKI